jgi:2-phospho-L-lactate/phosphoenolpyruvate guanylyltransferase
MRTFAIVPVKRFDRSKSRLGAILSSGERRKLSELLLVNTIRTLQQSRAISSTIIVTSESSVVEVVGTTRAEFLKLDNDNGVNSALLLADKYSSQNGADATLVIPQDIPLLSATDINNLCSRAESLARCIVICPSIRYDGTNALLRKPPRLMKTLYDKDSFNSHIRAAVKMNVPIRFFLSRRMMKDLDSAEDIRILMKEQVLNLPLAFLKSKL